MHVLHGTLVFQANRQGRIRDAQGNHVHRARSRRGDQGGLMTAGKRFTGFLLLQNMILKDFVRQGLVDQSLGAGEAERLSRLEALNAREIARWSRDLHPSADSAV